ncbi:2176_t:CDS:1, partial [Dentiscutata heterogama]
KCQACYSQNPGSSDNNLAFEELTKYISRSQSQCDENIDVYKWWQNSKHEFPLLQGNICLW